MLKIEYALWPHVEQQVEDAEVGQETMLLCKDLIVGTGGEVGIGKGMLRTDGLAEVIDRLGL